MERTMCSSADKKLQEFLESVQEDHSHRRMVQQEVKCGFGLDGVCCRLCSNGPCRISKARPKGVCGADRDTIAARNFLRSVAAGSGCYIHVAEQAAKELKSAALTGRTLRGISALRSLCSELGIDGADDSEKALCLAEAVLEDLHRPCDEKMRLTKKLAYGKRTGLWEKAGILPGGAKDEIFNAVLKTSTNLNSDPMDMLAQCLRLGISTGVYGLVLVNRLNDILMGEPELGFDPVGMRVIDPECINIMVTGHQHSMFAGLTELLERPEIKAMAEKAGARGIRIVGCTCVGQDFQARGRRYEDVFCGHAGNNYSSEAVLMTGCIDLVVSEFNCSLPGIEPVCEKRSIPMLCLDDVAKKKGARYLPYSAAEREDVSINVIAAAIASYARRVKTGKRQNPMEGHGCGEAITGVTEMTLKGALGGSFVPLADLIAAGRIKGVAAVVGCSNLRARGHDVFTVELVKKLIAKDILVLSAGCTCGGLENCGLMSRKAAGMAGPGLSGVCQNLGIPPVLNFGPCLAIGRIEAVAGELAGILGVDLPQLPVVVSAPQWLEEQALADGAFALALGFHLHLGLAPFVTGSPVIMDVLCNKMEEMTGGKLFVETEIDQAANQIEAVIMDKRRGLGFNE